MADATDHLDKEVSVGVDVTPTSVQAKAKSRLVSSLDRLGGSFFDTFSSRNERVAARERAVAAGEIAIIEAIAKTALERVDVQNSDALKIFRDQVQDAQRKRANVDGVIESAIEDLRREPPSETQNQLGSERIEDSTIDRLKRYAEDASTDELRERWGRIFAAEVRTPGVVSNKVMRIVDEMSPEQAVLFEDYCGSLIHWCVPHTLRELDYAEWRELESAGLVADSRRFAYGVRSERLADGRWGTILHFDWNRGVFFPNTQSVKNAMRVATPHEHFGCEPSQGDVIYVTCGMLSSEGKAVASILPNRQIDALNRLHAVLQSKVEDRLYLVRRVDDVWVRGEECVPAQAP